MSSILYNSIKENGEDMMSRRRMI